MRSFGYNLVTGTGFVLFAAAVVFFWFCVGYTIWALIP